jgi:hypothetical protein
MLVKGENGYGILFDKKCCLIGGLEWNVKRPAGIKVLFNHST